MANANFPQSRIYSGHYAPVLIDFNFIVNNSDTGGLGITALKGQYVKNVYMNTSATPATGNPNPLAGYILVQFNSTYNGLLYSTASDIAPNSGSNIAIDSTSLTLGQAYVITVLGTSLLADWVAIGVPIGVTPAVGVSFICIKTGNGAGSGQVQVPKATGSGITRYESIGTPNTTLMATGPGFSTLNRGAWLIFQCLAPTSSGSTTLVATAPAAGTTISLQCLFSNTSLLLGGQ